MLIFTVFCANGLQELRSNHGARAWFGPDGKLSKQLDRYEQEFENDQKFVIGLHIPSGVFRRDFLIDYSNLVEELLMVPDVMNLTSLKSAPFITTQNDEIIIRSLLPDNLEDLSTRQVAKIKQKATNEKTMRNYLVDKEGRSLVIIGNFRPFFDDRPDFKKIMNQVKQSTEKLKQKYPELQTYYIGGFAVNYEMGKITERDLSTIMPITLVVMALLLFLLTGSLIGVIYPLSVLLITLICTLGMAGHLGITLNNLLSITPGILIAICIADTIHLIKSTRAIDPRHILTVMQENTLPTLLTTITTAIGFLSLALSEIVPIAALGFLISIGCIVAWLATFILYPFFFLNNQKLNLFKINRSKQHFGPLLKGMHKLATQRRKTIILVFFLPVVIAMTLFKSIEVNTNVYQYVTSQSPLVRGKEFFVKQLGGMIAPAIVIKADQDTILNSSFLRKVDAFQNHLKKKNYITAVSSFIDHIKKVNQALHNGDPQFYKIPKSNRQIAEIHLLLTMSLPEGGDLKQLITNDLSKLQLSTRWTIEQTKDLVNVFFKDIQRDLKTFQLDGYIGGKSPIFGNLSFEVVKTFFTSVGFTIAIVMLLMCFIFRSFKIGLVSILPNIIPLSVGICIMKFCGFYFDVGTVIVFSVCFGVAIDDTIHFLVNYFQLKKYQTGAMALNNATIHVGEKLIVTTLTLGLGFGMLYFGEFRPNRNFGILSILILFVALLTDLILLPAILKENDENKNFSRDN